MIALATTWELGWDSPLREYDLWRFLVREFEVDGGLWAAPVSGIRARGLLHERADFSAIREELGLQPVFLDEHGTIPLHELEHPDCCVYVTGATGASCLAHARPGDMCVRVRTPLGGGGLWGHQAACLALYDRQVKSWPRP